MLVSTHTLMATMQRIFTLSNVVRGYGFLSGDLYRETFSTDR